ncbi:hypothetical protein EV2_004514 [Malus domestica]
MGHLVSVVELGKLVLHRYGPQNVSRPLIQNTQNDPHIRRALKDISKSSTAIRALIINFFCISALPIAKELHIPTHYFYTSGAEALAAFLYFPKLHEQTTKSFQDLTNTVFDIPGLKSPLKAIHLVQPMLDRDRPAYWDMLYFCSHLPKSNGIIVNTVEELEPASILKAIVQGLCVSDGPTPPVYHIGPLIDEEKEPGNATAEGEEDCLLCRDISLFRKQGIIPADSTERGSKRVGEEWEEVSVGGEEAAGRCENKASSWSRRRP